MYWSRTPPPQVQKSGGSLPAPIAVCNCVLMLASLMKSTVMLSPGWAALKDWASALRARSWGLAPPVVVSAQMVRFAVAAAEELPLAAEVALLELLELVVLLELLLHAAAPVATAAASATAASARLLLRIGCLLNGVMGARGFESFRILSTCRHRKIAVLHGQPPISVTLQTFSYRYGCRTMQQERRCSSRLSFR